MKKLTLFYLMKNEIFVAEALKLAVIDTACTKAVAGEDWYNDYIIDLSKKYKEKLQILKSSTSLTLFAIRGEGVRILPLPPCKLFFTTSI